MSNFYSIHSQIDAIVLAFDQICAMQIRQQFGTLVIYYELISQINLNY